MSFRFMCVTQWIKQKKNIYISLQQYYYNIYESSYYYTVHKFNNKLVLSMHIIMPENMNNQ